MFNKFIYAGYLTRDPEVRYTPSGTPIANLTVAVNSKVKQGDETKEEVLFMDTVVFSKMAEHCKEYLSKGSPVLIEGRLRERKWEYEGQQKSKFEVVANSIRFLPSANQNLSKAKSSTEHIAVPYDVVNDTEPF